MTSLRDGSILVIGATGGLGAPISRRLASEGALLTLHGRDPGRLESLGRRLAVFLHALDTDGTPTEAQRRDQCRPGTHERIKHDPAGFGHNVDKPVKQRQRLRAWV